MAFFRKRYILSKVDQITRLFNAIVRIMVPTSTKAASEEQSIRPMCCNPSMFAIIFFSEDLSCLKFSRNAAHVCCINRLLHGSRYFRDPLTKGEDTPLEGSRSPEEECILLENYDRSNKFIFNLFDPTLSPCGL